MALKAKIALIVGALGMASCGPLLGPAATPTPSPRPASIERHLLFFDEIYRLIQQGYVYSDYGGVDWGSEGLQVRAQIEAGMSDAQLDAALQELLSLLPTGTATLLSRQQRIAAELASTQTYEGIGAYVSVRSEPVPRIILLSIIEGSPAQQAGLLPHDAINAVDGIPVRADDQ